MTDEHACSFVLTPDHHHLVNCYTYALLQFVTEAALAAICGRKHVDVLLRFVLPIWVSSLKDDAMQVARARHPPGSSVATNASKGVVG